jgi:hypothetical protein
MLGVGLDGGADGGTDRSVSAGFSPDEALDSECPRPWDLGSGTSDSRACLP